MDFAFVLDPLSGIKTYKDSSFAMLREAAKRGHRLYAMQQADIALAGGSVIGSGVEITLTGDADDWYRAGDALDRPLAKFDAVLMRKDPPFDMEYVYITYLLERAEA